MRNNRPFQSMRKVSAIEVVRRLKACATQKDLIHGSKLHAYIEEHKFLQTNSHVASALIHMYVKCGALTKAQQVLKELPVRDVVTWSALIAGYARQGQGDEALKCYDNMEHEGHSPDAVTFTVVLKACGSIGAADKGERIHDTLVSLGMLEKDIMLGNALVDMYAKCGAFSRARQVLKELPVRDVVTWNALIAGYAQHGQGEEALNCYDSMQHEGLSPDNVTFVAALKACGIIGAVAKGERIHGKIVNLDMLKKSIVLGGALVNMYAKCGALAKAQQVLEELPVRDVVAWSALISGYAQKGQGEEALKCYDNMQHEGHTADAVTFMFGLKACASIGAAAKGEEIHHKIVRLGMLEKNTALGSSLVDMYAKCGVLAKAHTVLKELPCRDMAAWSALMAGYVHQEQGEEALKCYDGMQHEGFSPDAITFTCALKACGSIGSVGRGEQIHRKMVSLGILEKNVWIGSSLVDMYAKCGALDKAQQILEGLPVQEVVTWNALITGYTQQGHYEEALKCYDSMQSKGHSPNAATFTCALRACGSIGASVKGEEIHNDIVSLDMLEKDIALGSALVDMYAKCAALTKAQKVLDDIPFQDVAMWNALMAGYIQQGQGEAALKCYDNMQCYGHFPSAATFTCALKACGCTGAVAKGKQIHDKIVSLDMLEEDILLGVALVEMYTDCAALHEAIEVPRQLPLQNVATWNALIGGYAQQGQSLEAFNCFQLMRSNGVNPDSMTLLYLLNACSHSGLLDQAEMTFSRISSEYNIRPDIEHYCCMIDLFGRAGDFDKALLLIEKMPSDENLPAWVALLGACHKWGEIEIGHLALERAVSLDASNSAIYLSMLKIYTTAGMQEGAGKD